MIHGDGNEPCFRGMTQQMFLQEQKQCRGIAAAGNGGEYAGARRQIELFE
jgi:hypothetical protein